MPTEKGPQMLTNLDKDLLHMSREQLTEEARRLQGGIRQHRDSSGHDLCWHHPQLWELLPEPIPHDIAVPPWPKFSGCIKYRQALEKELPGARVADEEYQRHFSARRRLVLSDLRRRFELCHQPQNGEDAWSRNFADAPRQ